MIGIDAYSVKTSLYKLCHPSMINPMPVQNAENEYNFLRSIRSTTTMDNALAPICTSDTIIAHIFGESFDPASLKMVCVYVSNGQAPDNWLQMLNVIPMSIAFFAAGFTTNEKGKSSSRSVQWKNNKNLQKSLKDNFSSSGLSSTVRFSSVFMGCFSWSNFSKFGTSLIFWKKFIDFSAN